MKSMYLTYYFIGVLVAEDQNMKAEIHFGTWEHMPLPPQNIYFGVSKKFE
jgi:hypothetical protein